SQSQPPKHNLLDPVIAPAARRRPDRQLVSTRPSGRCVGVQPGKDSTPGGTRQYHRPVSIAPRKTVCALCGGVFVIPCPWMLRPSAQLPTLAAPARGAAAGD